MDFVFFWNKMEIIEFVVYFLYEVVFVIIRRCVYVGVQSFFGVIVGYCESISFVDLQELKFKDYIYNVFLEYSKL